MSFTATSLDAIAPRDYDWDGTDWLPIRHELGVEAFGLNAWRARTAGAPVVEPHDEAGGPEEVYVVLRGRATFTIAGETLDAPAGTCVRIDPEDHREAVAAEDDTVVLALGAKRGEAFSPSAWEARELEKRPPRS